MKSIKDLTHEHLDNCFKYAFDEPMAKCAKRIASDHTEVYSYQEKTGDKYVLILWFNGEFTGENRGPDGKQSTPIIIRNKAVADYINSL